MAFIREYAAAGDPFSLRVPKRFRKLKLGRAIGRGIAGLARGALKVASFAAPVIAPMAGGAFFGGSKFLRFVRGGSRGSKVIRALLSRGAPLEQATEFARSYGLVPQAVEEELGYPGLEESPEEMDVSAVEGDEGDVMRYYMGMGDPAPTPSRKRKTAGAGPRVKAAKKRARRQQKARPAAPNVGGSVAENLRGLLGSGVGGLPGDIAALLHGGKGGKGAFGGHRKRVNPGNVKALRRSIRRVESFERLVKSVERAYPRVKHARPSHTGGRARGHRAGCACAVCRRAA